MSFVFSCDKSKEKSAMERIDDTIHLFFDAMKRRNKSPIGPMVIDYLKKTRMVFTIT